MYGAYFLRTSVTGNKENATRTVYKGAIQIVAPVIRENYAAFNSANRKQGD
jgi:hypothetical protein